MKNKLSVKNILSTIVILAIVLIGVIYSIKISISVDIEDTVSLGNTLGVVSLLPTVLAIYIAFAYKNVVLALLGGSILGATMYVSLKGNSVFSFFGETCKGMVETVADSSNASILVLCLAIGGLVEIIRNSGGFEDLAKKMTKRINTPTKANLIAQLLGVVVFFDDYANSLIVGPVMRPIMDKLKISREKLAYIVDSTAAPVTGIAIISSWVAVEVAVIEEGLANASANMSGYALFLQAIPYCFYCIFCLLFIFISSITKKEFGPMLKAENDARKGLNKKDESHDEELLSKKNKKASLWVAILPLIFLFVFAVYEFYTTGKVNAIEAGLISGNEPFSIRLLSTIFGQADTIFIVFEASVFASFIAIILGILEKVFTLKEGILSFLKGCSQLLETDIILVLAWTMSSFVSKIGTVHYAVNVISSNVAWFMIPLLIFIACCVVSFAVGSYGCMFIALPMAIPIAISIMKLNPHIGSYFLPLVIACGLAGSIFGDHCSPITDCTILSSEGSGCNNFDHVKTQLPYALVTAIVAILVGIIPATFGLSPILSFIGSIVAFYLILKVFGKVPSEE